MFLSCVLHKSRLGCNIKYILIFHGFVNPTLFIMQITSVKYHTKVGYPRVAKRTYVLVVKLINLSHKEIVLYQTG